MVLSIWSVSKFLYTVIKGRLRNWLVNTDPDAWIDQLYGVFNKSSVISRWPVHLPWCFSGVLFTSTLHNIISICYWLLPHITIAKTMDSGERGMNLVTMTIINPLKKYWPSLGIEPETSCVQVLHSTDWAMGLGRSWQNKNKEIRNLFQSLWGRRGLYYHSKFHSYHPNPML